MATVLVGTPWPVKWVAMLGEQQPCWLVVWLFGCLVVCLVAVDLCVAVLIVVLVISVQGSV